MGLDNDGKRQRRRKKGGETGSWGFRLVGVLAAVALGAATLRMRHVGTTPVSHQKGGVYARAAHLDHDRNFDLHAGDTASSAAELDLAALKRQDAALIRSLDHEAKGVHHQMDLAEAKAELTQMLAAIDDAAKRDPQSAPALGGGGGSTAAAAAAAAAVTPVPPGLEEHIEGTFKWMPLTDKEGGECGTMQRLSSTETLGCDRLEEGRTKGFIELADPKIDGGAIMCGGFRLTPGLCTRWAKGSYVRTGPAPPPPSPDESLCWNRKEIFAKGGGFALTGLAVPRSEFVPKGCRMLPTINLGPTLLKALIANKQPHTRFVLMGDSHTRNVMTATPAAFRNEELLVEGHPSKSVKAAGHTTLYHYWLDDSNVLQDSVEDILDSHSKNESVFNQARHFCDDKSVCITTMFLWAPLFSEQQAYLPLIQSIYDPHSMVNAISSYEKAPFSDELRDVLYKYFADTKSSLRYWGFMTWPYGNSNEAKREAIAATMITKFKNSGYRHVRQGAFWSHKWFHEYSVEYGENGLQTLKTWHSVCGNNRNWPEKPFALQANENCTGLVARSYVRSFWTNYMSLLRGGGHSDYDIHGA